MIVSLILHELEGVDLALASTGADEQAVLVAIVLGEQEVRVVPLELILALLGNSHHPFQVPGDVAFTRVELILVGVQGHRRCTGRVALFRVVGHSFAGSGVNDDHGVTRGQIGGIHLHPLHLHIGPCACNSYRHDEQEKHRFE